MSSLRWIRPFLFVAAGLLVSADLAMAQGRPGGGTGRPSFPPGLHDRTLPPGRPFSPPDNFDPPGRTNFGEDEDFGEVVSRLARLLDDERFPEEGTLAEAVNAYNYLVLSLDEADRARPPATMVAAQVILPRALGLDGTRFASGDASPTRADGPLQFQLLPGGSVQVLEPLDPWTLPGMSAATPIAFGAEWGTVWAGASYQPKVRYNDGNDGAAAVGFGLGDADRYVGLQVGINSFSTVRGGFGERVGVDLQLHRRFGGLYSVAVGWESVGAAYDVTRDSGKSLYVAGSRWLQFRDDPDAPFGLGMVTLGVGSGRFQLEEDFYARKDGVGVFGSVGVRVLKPVSVIAEWTGQDLMLATSITPLRDHGLAITAGFTEVTGAAGDGARFTIGAGMGFSFR